MAQNRWDYEEGDIQIVYMPLPGAAAPKVGDALPDVYSLQLDGNGEEPAATRGEAQGSVLPTAIPAEAIPHLGVYVYALRDPSTQEVFYVGKGRGNRIYQHVWAAIGNYVVTSNPSVTLGNDDSPETVTAKNERIRRIFDSGNTVEHWVIRHHLEKADSADEVAFAVEQTLIDALQLNNADLTNVVAGHKKTAFGMSRVEDLIHHYSAQPAPALPIPCALIKVNAAANLQATPEDIYRWSRAAWRAGHDMRQIRGLPIIVFADDVVRAVHRVEAWKPARNDSGRKIKNCWQYTGQPDDALEAVFKGKSLRDVREARPNHSWRQHGWHPYPAPNPK